MRGVRGAKRVSKDEGLTLQDTRTQVGFTQLAYLKCRSRVNQRSVCAPQHAAERPGLCPVVPSVAPQRPGLNRPGLQPEGRIPEHPLELGRAREGSMHPRAQGW